MTGRRPVRWWARVPWTPLLTVTVVAAVVALLPSPPPAPIPVADVQPPHQWQPGVLRVGLDASYPPFATRDGGVLTGHDVELSRRLAAHLGWRLELVDIPFDGLYDALRVSRIDVIVSALPRQEEMSGAVIYSRPYFEAGDVLVVRHADGYGGLHALQGRRIGAEMGSLGDQAARRQVREHRFALDSSFTSLDAALAALRDGHIDAVAVDRVTALIRRAADPTLNILDPPLDPAPYVIAMPFDAPDFAESVDRWLDDLDRTGQLTQMRRAHIG